MVMVMVLEIHGEVHGGTERSLATIGFTRESGIALAWREPPQIEVTLEQTGGTYMVTGTLRSPPEEARETVAALAKRLDGIGASYELELYAERGGDPVMAWRTAVVGRVHVGFTGTRFGATEPQLATMRALLGGIGANGVAHHGDCIGADAQFHATARVLGWRVVVHPGPVDDADRAGCDHDELRAPLTHMKRNKAIVLESHRVMAVPKDLDGHGGTWKTIEMARKAKRPLVIVRPDGSVDGAWPA